MKPVSRRKALIGGVAISAAAALPAVTGGSKAALANGEEFFGAEEIPGHPVFVYFGTVKSEDGKYLEAAEVMLKVQDPPMTFTTFTDILGRFRTLDAGRTLTDLGYTYDGTSNFVMSVTRDGWVQTRRMNRAPAHAKEGAYEINFIMAPDPTGKAKPTTGFEKPLTFKSTPAIPANAPASTWVTPPAAKK